MGNIDHVEGSLGKDNACRSEHREHTLNFCKEQIPKPSTTSLPKGCKSKLASFRDTLKLLGILKNYSPAAKKHLPKF